MNKLDALLSFIEHTDTDVSILIVDSIDVQDSLVKIAPHAKCDTISLNSLSDNKIELLREYYDYVIIADLLKNTIEIQDILYKINMMLKLDGCLLSIIDNNCYWNDVQRYAKISSAAKFRKVIVLEDNDVYCIKSIKFRQDIINLKRCYTHQIRRKLANLLHRIEHNIDIKQSTIELALLCQKYNMSEEYLNKYIENAVIDKNNLYNNLMLDVDEKKYDRHRCIRDRTAHDVYPSDKKILFIICVNDNSWYDESIKYLEDLIVPDGYGVEILPVRNATSMCAGYNYAMNQIKAKYKVYMHQDCLILNKNFIVDVLDIFKDNNIGCIGMMGVNPLPPNAIWWSSKDRFGRVVHSNYPEEVIELQCYIDSPLKDVDAVDGLMIITQYDIEWREDIFTGWHFYDISMCYEMRKRGYRVVVPRQDKAWCMHCPSDKLLDDSYEKYRNIYLQYSGMNDME